MFERLVAPRRQAPGLSTHGHQRHYEWEMVTLLQRTARWKLRARKIGLKKSSVNPS